MKLKTFQFQFSALFSFLILLLISGCSTKPAFEPPAIPTEKIYIHTVSFSGENLPMVSEWYTGSYKNWKTIKPYNAHLQTFILPKGAKVRIPEHLISQTLPMTVEFVTKKKNAYISRSKKLSQASPTPTPTETASASPTPENTPELNNTDDQAFDVYETPLQDELIENLLK